MIARQKRLIKGGIGMLAAVVSTLCLAQAPVAYSTYRTTSGCEVSDMRPEVDIQGSEWTKSWSGACVGGKAEGWGMYSTKTRGITFRFSSEVTYRGIAHEGRQVGYASVYTYISSRRSMPGSTSWQYTADGQNVGGSGNLGLTISALAMDSPTVALPRSVKWRAPASLPTAAQTLGGFYTLSRSIVLLAVPCSVKVDRFPDCKPGSPKAAGMVFFLNEQRVEQRPGVTDPSKKVTFCPDPFSLDGCEATVEQVIAPYRQEALDFIERTKPSVEALLAASRAKLAAVPQKSAMNNLPAR